MKLDHIFYALLLVGISSLLMGMSIFLIGPHKHIQLTTDFYHLSKIMSANAFNILAAVSFIGVGALALITLKTVRLRGLLGYLLIALSLIPIGSLAANTMWIESLGGFPIIGSGQGVIKYFALLSVGILLLKPEMCFKKKASVAIFPVLLVLLWIGCMKFMEFEAQGIEALVKTSPFMAWMYNFWSLQTTSNLIGTYDLIAMALLILAIYQPKLLVPSIAMSGAVFLVTQTFLFTFEGALSGQTLLTTIGHFLIKDLWFIANLLFFYSIMSDSRSENT